MLIRAPVAGPPSPLELAKPLPTTVVIVPIDAPEELGEVAATGPVSDRFGPAGSVSEPEQAAPTGVKTRIAVIVQMRPDLLDCPLLFTAITFFLRRSRTRSGQRPRCSSCRVAPGGRRSSSLGSPRRISRWIPAGLTKTGC